MPISPPPVRRWRPEYIPAYLSNGVIGLRAGPIPLIEGVAIVNGLAAVDPVEKGEGFARGPYPIGGDLEIDGTKLSRLAGQTEFVEQAYDFAAGELTSRFTLRSGETTATVEVLTFCSRSLPTVALQEVQVRVDRPCRLVLTAKLDPTGISGAWRSRETTTPDADNPVVDGSMLWETHGGLSTCGAAYNYLHASAHSSSLFSTSMFGLAYWPNYHYYRGHVMWDIEAFTFPTLLLTAPESAYALLEYRVQRLQAAERNAAMYGYRGLQFPWASGPRHGEEVIRLSAPHLVFEQHISLSVANAFAQYVHATGDEDYLRETAWPVLEGVANWLVSRAVQTERGYEIKQVIGVAEQTDPVDNNAYVNMAASMVLQEAAAFACRLKRPDADRWNEIARGMYLPVDTDRRIILNHDRYSPADKGVAASTPEALAGLFPFNYPVEGPLERATIEFYLDRAGEFVGYPMLSALLGTYAARLGDRAGALHWFEKGYADFIEGPFTETNEFSRKRFPEKPRTGPFMANLGGFLMSCLYGLTGLQLSSAEPAEWLTRPVVLPHGWDAIEVERLFVRGRPARLLAPHGAARATLEMERL